MTSNPPPTPSFGQRHQLPFELIVQIITHVTVKADLSRLMRVSSEFYLLACPILYDTIEIDLSLPRHPLSSLHSSPRTSTSAGILQSLPSRFSYTTSLTINSHFKEVCQGMAPLNMPALRTLRSRPTKDTNDSLNLCCSRGSAYLNSMSSNPTPSRCCPLIANLRPRQIILGGRDSGFDVIYTILWPITTFGPQPAFNDSLPNFVEEVAIMIGSGIQLSRANNDWLMNAPSTVRRLTCVMCTWDTEAGEKQKKAVKDEVGQGDESGAGDDDEDEEEMDWEYRGETLDSDSVLKNLADVLSGEAQMTEVVGYETVNDAVADDGELKEELASHLEEMNDDEEDVKKRIDSLRFFKGGEFLQESMGDAELWKSREQIRRAVVVEGKMVLGLSGWMDLPKPCVWSRSV